MSKRSVPKGFHTITPNIIADDAEKAVAFLKEAFGVTEKLPPHAGEREDYAL